MTDHLSECPLHSGCSCPWMSPCDKCSCICAELRACEQRVWDEAYACGFNAGRDHGEKVGRAAGLDAAQEAVAALFPVRRYQSEHEAILAAIDALRGES